MGVSKNSKNSTGGKASKAMKFSLSSECEACVDKCERGKAYLERFKIKHGGNGVPCVKK